MGLFNRKKDGQDGTGFLGLFGSRKSHGKDVLVTVAVSDIEPAKDIDKVDAVDVAPRSGSKPSKKSIKIVVDAAPVVDTAPLQAALSPFPSARGDKLLAAAKKDAVVAEALTCLVQSIAQLDSCVLVALGHRRNVATTSVFFTETLAALEAQGEKLSVDSVAAVNAVRACVDDARELAISCSQAGWLARMAYACAMDAEFPRLASKAVSTLRAAGLGARLCAPAFMESGKAMRNLLKELGNGSVDAGIVRLRADTTAQALVAKAADVPVAAVEKDAKQHPTLVGATQLVTDASARQAECDRVFHDYVTSSYNSITSDGFERLCIDLGILDGINPEDQAAAARTALVAADGDYDGALSFDEFQSFYLRHPVTSIRLHLRVTAGLAMERRVRHTFAVFAAFGSPKKGASPENSPTLDCSRFAKLCRDSGLLGGGMTAQHVDVVYTSAKPREARRMTFDHFICALTMVANRRGQPLETVLELVAAVRRPALHGTQAGFVKLHDDKDMITGVCARGGPSLGAVNLDLRMIVDRSKEPKSPPPPSGAVPKRVDPTRPESPKLATKDRIVSSGPVTPGRGASLAAKEQRDAAKLLAMASPRGAHSVFGRTSTPRAAQLATPRGGRKSGAAMRLDTTRVGELLIPVSQSQASTQWVSMSDSVAMLGRNEEDAVEVSGSGADMDALFEEALAQEADGGDGELRVADILLANEEGLTGDECFAGAGEDTHETEGSVVQDEVAEARGLQPQAETPKGEETVLSDILDKCMVLGEEHVTEEGG